LWWLGVPREKSKIIGETGGKRAESVRGTAAYEVANSGFQQNGEKLKSVSARPRAHGGEELLPKK
jgi:hypothetical protein